MEKKSLNSFTLMKKTDHIADANLSRNGELAEKKSYINLEKQQHRIEICLPVSP